MKKVSIIAPFYDESIDNFKRQYNSIKNQSLKNFEYIIILDNPNNLALENHIKSQIKGKKNIILIKNKKNIGCNPSLNKGIKKASGKYICFIGGSDELPKNSLKDRYVSLSNNPDIAVIFSNWTEIDESKKSISRKFPSKNIDNITKAIFFHRMLCNGTMMIKRPIIKKIKFPKYFRGGDFEVILNLIILNYKFTFSEKNTYYYYKTVENSNLKYEKIKEYSHNFLILLLNKFPHFFKDKYYLFRLFETFVEFIFSRNKLLFKIYLLLERISKSFFRR